ncbi:MAG TPA: hypothetical protein PKC28_09650 [Bdellovibrionales bacterium]|nr:hypothetical protein [Bdellovibrionales bacterium]
MNIIQQLSLASLIGFFSAAAYAVDPVTIACYGSDTNAYFLVDPDYKSLTFSYSKGQFQESYTASPDSAFSEANSYVRLERTPDLIKFKVQIVTGDVITPIFHTNADVVVARNAASGDWSIQSAEGNHFDRPYDFQGVIGHRCYVQ